MAVAALSAFAIDMGERRSHAAQLRERASTVASALERRANTNASFLRAGAALFATLYEVPPSRFRSFVSELRLDADYRGSEGIGWAPRVSRGEVAAFQASMSQDYGKPIMLHPAMAPGQSFAVPVAYLEPDVERNHRALGFDMYSERVRRAAMEEAERTARPTASGKVVLMQAGVENQTGFLIYMPVFATSSDGARLRGYVYSAFNAQAFLASVLDAQDRGKFSIQVYDRYVAADRLMAGSNTAAGGGASVSVPLTIASHPWVLVVSSPKAALLSPLSVVTLLFGLAAACLLSLVANILTRQALEDSARLSWFEEQNSIRDSLTRELNHRVKNTLANVLSIVALTRRRASTLDDFAEGLVGRIRALSATHDLLTQSDWGPTPIAAVVEAELAPYARDAGPVIAMEGEAVELAPSDALSLGLAIHELATNAAKYGALSQQGGRLSVKWGLTEGGKARIDWEETGGPPVAATRRRGFGMDLIEKIVAHELQNPVEMIFDPGGLRCTLIVPVRSPRPFAIRRKD